jgi:hypothetical protein
MTLYVCWGTFPLPTGHACNRAHSALTEAGYRPKVVRSYGSRMLPDFLNVMPGRREAKKLTGRTDVPLLVTDDDEVIQGSKQIADWAKAHPAS